MFYPQKTNITSFKNKRRRRNFHTKLINNTQTRARKKMASKILANLIVMGSGAVFRAASQAWQKALENARKSGINAESTAQIIRKQISIQESRQILNTTENATKEEMLRNFREQFLRNKGKSFYVQSKIFRAKEHLGMEVYGMDAEEAGYDPRVEGEGEDGGSRGGDGAKEGRTGEIESGDGDDDDDDAKERKA